MGQGLAGGGGDGALKAKGRSAQGYGWVENLMGLGESCLTELEI